MCIYIYIYIHICIHIPATPIRTSFVSRRVVIWGSSWGRGFPISSVRDGMHRDRRRPRDIKIENPI